MIEEARRRAAQCGLPVQFELAEALRLPWQSDHFNACRADRLLQHLPQPDQVLSEMLRVLKPGGRIVVVDRDWGMVALDSADSTTTQAVLNRACDGIRNGWMGRKLNGLFKRAGVTEVQIEAHSITRFDMADSLRDLCIVSEHAVRERRITRTAVDAWLDDLLERGHAGTSLAALTLYVAFGRKRPTIYSFLGS